MSKCLKFCKTQIGTQTKALDETNWFASRVFLANQKWHSDIQISQKHVKMLQILQNAIRYSNESSRRNKLICLKGFSGKSKMTLWQPSKSKTQRIEQNSVDQANFLTLTPIFGLKRLFVTAVTPVKYVRHH